MDDLPELRAAVPALEPDPVLLGQLVELSAASAAADTAVRTRLRPARALITGAAALGLVATTSWIAGALPGVPSPIAPHESPGPSPTAPATPHRTGHGPVPSRAPSPTLGASDPHDEAPGVAVPRGHRTGGPHGTAPAPSARPGGGAGGQGENRGKGQQGGQGQGNGNGNGKQKDEKQNPGRHRGQEKPHPPRPDKHGTEKHGTGSQRRSTDAPLVRQEPLHRGGRNVTR